MRFFQNNRLFFLYTIFLVLLYFSFRLYRITYLPIFTDEAIYTRWAQIALNDSNWRFISLTDGKQPMFVWLAMISMKLFNDPVFSARMVSVFAGFFTMIGLWILTWEVFRNKYASFLSVLVYICYPFAQVYDRMALYDSLVATFYTWALYFSILLIRGIRLDIAYTLGFIIGGGILTKSTNFFSIYLLPFTLILFDWQKSNLKKRLFTWIGLIIVVFLVSYAIYFILRLSPLFSMVNIKNATFVYPFSEWIKNPGIYLITNAKSLITWLFEYLNPIYIILIISSFFFYRKYQKEKLLLFLYFILPFIALIIFAKTLFPRFIFFMTIPLLSLVSLGLYSIIERINKLFIKVLLVLLFVGYSAFVSFKIAYDPINAPISIADSSQYINNWTAGWGVVEIIALLREEAKDKKIFIATEGTFGLMPASLELYLVQNKNIKIKGYWPLDSIKLPKEVLDSAKNIPTYFVFYQPQHFIIPSSYPLKLIFQKQQGNSSHYLRLYKVDNK
ncbi:hypothetical protein LBMAG33_0940 [Candidatus Levyibacteriota bacterium]|nr:hypothetical protein [Candidatus Levybacteria bacterium]GDX61784.1 hypothetical protein LBMAG33_0940 [Candidatus Levybacteria bacterium]